MVKKFAQYTDCKGTWKAQIIKCIFLTKIANSLGYTKLCEKLSSMNELYLILLQIRPKDIRYGELT